MRTKSWSKAQQVIDEVDDLMRRLDRTEAPRSAPCACSCSAREPELRPDFFKKMFLLMMQELA